MRKVLSLLIIIATSITLTSCKTDKIQIGILQLIEHNALSDSRKGFLDVLSENGYVDGVNINVNLNIPEADNAIMKKQAKRLVRKSDLVLSIATPAAISVKAERSKLKSNVPILFTAVTDPIDAKLITSNENPGGNVSGTNDLSPIDKQIDLAKELLPNIKTIGIIYNQSEPNSSIQAKIAKEYAIKIGLNVVEKTFLNSSDLKNVANALAKDVELIYAPTDNLLASNTGLLNAVALEHKIPFIVGAETMVDDLPGLTIGINYYELGRLTGKMALEILNGKNAGLIPSTGLENFGLKINREKLEAIGINIPESLLERVDD